MGGLGVNMFLQTQNCFFKFGFNLGNKISVIHKLHAELLLDYRAYR